MPGPKKPMQLNLLNGGKHWTKDEIKERLSTEVQPRTEEIAAPSYLTASQKKTFTRLARQLEKIGIMGETDCDTLARYVTAQSLYEQAVKDLRTVEKQKPKYMTPLEIMKWAGAMETLDKRTDKYFKQAQTAARSLGLTISDRCRLSVPTVGEEKPKENKFSKFGSGKAAGNE